MNLRLDTKYRKILKRYSEHASFNVFRKELKILSMIITLIVINLKINLHNPASPWRSLELTKNHVMTLVYMSMSYSCKERYHKMFLKYSLMPSMTIRMFDIISFFDKGATNYLNIYKYIHLIKTFIQDVCRKDPITRSNLNLSITIEPKKLIKKQIGCPSFNSGNKRPPQLILRLFDIAKVCFMLMANVAHIMDSALIYTYTLQLCTINQFLSKKDSFFSSITPTKEPLYYLNLERNHDCYLLTNGFLLDISICDCYRWLATQDYLSTMSMGYSIKRKYTKMHPGLYSYLINNLNPNYAQY